MIKFRQFCLLALVVVGPGIANGGENLFEGKGSHYSGLSSKMNTHEIEDIKVNKVNYEPIDYFYEFGCDIGNKAIDGMALNYFMDPVSYAYQIMQKGFGGIKGIAVNGLYYVAYPLRINLDHLKGVEL